MRITWALIGLVGLFAAAGCTPESSRDEVRRPVAATARVTIGDETRPSLDPAEAPSVRSRHVEIERVPAGARLEIAYGVAPAGWDASAAAATFHILVAGREQPLFYARLDPATFPSQRRWFTAVVDLGSFAGRPITLMLETNLDRAPDRRAISAPVWGEPLVLAPLVLAPTAAKPRLNLLLVAFDGVGPRDFGVYGSARPTTPTFDELAKGGVLFEHALTQSTSDRPVLISILTGLYPRAHRLLRVAQNPATPRFLTLAEMLRREGYATGGITDDPDLAVGTVDRGFDWFAVDRPEPRGTDADPARTLDHAAHWIATRRAVPWFLLVHAGAAGSAAAARPGGVEPPEERDAAMRALDGTLERLERTVAALGLSEQTLLVVTSTHGNGVGRDDAASPGDRLRGDTLRIPLLMRAPGRLAAGVRLSDQVGLIDVAPTVLEILGAAPAPQAHGLSLASIVGVGGDGGSMHETLDARPLYADVVEDADPSVASLAYAWRLPSLKVIWTPAAAGRPERFEAFDLARDPDETQDLFDERFGLHREALARYASTGQPFPADARGPFRRLP